MSPDVSIIVPARDEERYIGPVLSSILELTSDLSCELFVVDNGSVDDTRHIAEQHGVDVLELACGPVSAVRNFGVRRSHGKALVFLDADVQITPSWRRAFPGVLQSLRDDPMQVLGARCHAADDEGLLNRYWFNRLREYSASYVNSGNLLTSRSLFDAIGGFDETLTTAEDYDFCRRARRAGATIVEVPALVTLHLGYPQSFPAFVRRERWHGRQDFANLVTVRESKVAWLALANLATFGVCTVATIATLQPAWLLLYVGFALGLGTALTLRRFGFGGPRRFIATSALYVLYVWGRSLAGVDRLFPARTR